jgi:PAS domain S-box-containing protein
MPLHALGKQWGMNPRGNRAKKETLRRPPVKRTPQAAKRTSGDWLQLAFVRSLDGIVVVDDKGRFLHANDAAGRILGYPAKQLLRMSVGDLVMPGEDSAEERFQSYLKKKREYAEIAFVRPDGTTCVVEYAAIKMRAGQHLGILRDITQRKQAEDQLHKSERTEEALCESELRFRQMAACIPEVFWMGDPQISKIYYLSPAYETVWGRPCQEIYDNPKSYADAIYPEDLPHVAGSLTAERISQNRNLEYRIVRPDGEVRWIWEQGFPIFDEAGELVRVCGISQDITERKRTEMALNENQARLQSLSRQLIEAQECERRRIALELHDEIGQSLTALKLNLQTAQKSGKPQVFLSEGMDLIDSMISQLRDLSFDLRPTSLDDLGLGPALRAYANRQGRRFNFIVRLAMEPEFPRLPREVEIALFRIAQEALTNIAKHSKAKNVEIALAQRPTETEMRIRDDGIGFDVDSALKHAAGGASLGLLGIQERAKIIGARVSILSRPGRETTIAVTAPA